jgi:DNA-binding transcriptional MerR regulator
MPTQYPIRAVSKLTGIAIDTLRAWERRYHAVTPDRTGRGRLYSDADVHRLLLLQTALEGGHAIGQVALLSDAELQDIARAAFPLPSARPEAAPRAVSPELQPLLDAIEVFDYAKTNEELSRLALLLSPAGLVYDVVLPVMRLAGENWENGSFQIAQEHMLSACMRSLLGGLVRLRRPPDGAARLLLTTPTSELHEFGILSAAMLAVSHDLQIAYLGPDLPAPDILAAAEKCAPQAVVLGIMETNATLAVRNHVQRVAAELPASIELWLGGTGAAEVAGGAERRGALVLQDLPDFERHLVRLKNKHARQVAS